MDVNEELKFLGKFTKKSGGGSGDWGQVGVWLCVWGGGGCQGGCERRNEYFVKNKKMGGRGIGGRG